MHGETGEDVNERALSGRPPSAFRTSGASTKAGVETNCNESESSRSTRARTSSSKPWLAASNTPSFMKYFDRKFFLPFEGGHSGVLDVENDDWMDLVVVADDSDERLLTEDHVSVELSIEVGEPLPPDSWRRMPLKLSLLLAGLRRFSVLAALVEVVGLWFLSA